MENGWKFASMVFEMTVWKRKIICVVFSIITYPTIVPGPMCPQYILLTHHRNTGDAQPVQRLNDVFAHAFVGLLPLNVSGIGFPTCHVRIVSESSFIECLHQKKTFETAEICKYAGIHCSLLWDPFRVPQLVWSTPYVSHAWPRSRLLVEGLEELRLVPQDLEEFATSAGDWIW